MNCIEQAQDLGAEIYRLSAVSKMTLGLTWTPWKKF